MSLVIDEHGARLGKKGRSVYVRTPEGRMVTRSLYNLAEVIITSNCSISSQALELLAQNGIPVVLVKRGVPYATIHPFFNHGTVHTRREQLAAYWDERGVHLAVAFVRGGMRNRRLMLEYYARNRAERDPDKADALNERARMIREIEAALSAFDEPGISAVDSIRAELMGLEAQAARIYFSGLKLIIPPAFEFDGREKRPPKDPVNALLSYGYTLLYSRVLTAIAACGLEPFAGFLHADRSGKPSLVLDLVEEFRQVAVDRTVLRMLGHRMLSPEDFVEEGSRVIIRDGPRREFLAELLGGFGGNVRHTAGKSVPLVQVMMQQARMLVRFLIGKEREYRPYVFRW